MSDEPSASTPQATERSCVSCNKKQSELANPLKQCAKCQTQAYCSRDCQKADWKNHKKQCGSTPGPPTPGSLRNPPEEEVFAQAAQTVELMNALSHDPKFNIDVRSIAPSATGLKYLCDFVARTFREYWCPILPPQKFADLTADLTSFHGIDADQSRQDMAEKFAEVKAADESFDKDAWPPKFNSKLYGDCITRDMTAAMLVLTPSQQDMMGGRYDYSEEVKVVCRRISQRS